MKAGISEEFKVSKIKTYHNFIELELQLTPIQDGLITRGASLNIDYKGIKLATGFIIYPELWRDHNTLIGFVLNEWAFLF